MWGIRFVPVKNYLLFYIVREDEQKVYVLRFLYSKRNWQKILLDYVENEAVDMRPFLRRIMYRKMWKVWEVIY